MSSFIHYHRERNHQGLENRLITPMEATIDTAVTIVRRQRLGGLLKLLLQDGSIEIRRPRPVTLYG